MPKVMAALPNIGGALCSTPQSLAEKPRFTMLCGHVEQILLFNIFFQLSICALVVKI